MVGFVTGATGGRITAVHRLLAAVSFKRLSGRVFKQVLPADFLQDGAAVVARADSCGGTTPAGARCNPFALVVQPTVRAAARVPGVRHPFQQDDGQSRAQSVRVPTLQWQSEPESRRARVRPVETGGSARSRPWSLSDQTAAR